MPSPFENPQQKYLVLINSDNQHSLWPSRITIPEGWDVAHGEDSRQACLDYVDTHWTQLRPVTAISS